MTAADPRPAPTVDLETLRAAMARRLGVKALDERQGLFARQADEDYAADETTALGLA